MTFDWCINEHVQIKTSFSGSSKTNDKHMWLFFCETLVNKPAFLLLWWHRQQRWTTTLLLSVWCQQKEEAPHSPHTRLPSLLSVILTVKPTPSFYSSQTNHGLYMYINASLSVQSGNPVLSKPNPDYKYIHLEKSKTVWQSQCNNLYQYLWQQ